MKRVNKAQHMLQHIRQGKRSVEEYTIEFERIAAIAELDEAANLLFYKKGLSDWVHRRIPETLAQSMDA